MIRWVQGWFRASPTPRTVEQLADLIEATPEGRCFSYYEGEDIDVAHVIAARRRERRERDLAHVMRCGIDWPGAA